MLKIEVMCGFHYPLMHLQLENSSRKQNKKEEIANAFVCCLVVVTSINNKVLLRRIRNKSNKCAHTHTIVVYGIGQVLL